MTPDRKAAPLGWAQIEGVLCALVQDLCAVAPPPTQPLAKLDGVGRSPLGSGSGATAGTRRSTAADLLQEKFAVKVRQACCHALFA